MSKYSPLTSYLGRCSDSVTLTWPELNEIVNGLPVSASQYKAWWGGGHVQDQAWKAAGFEVTDVRLGSRVTFVRTLRRGWKGLPLFKTYAIFFQVNRGGNPDPLAYW